MLKKLIEKRNALLEEAEAIVEKAKAETRALSEEELEKFNEVKTEVDEIDKTIKADAKIRSLEKIEKEDEGEGEGEEGDAVEVQEERAFENYIRGKSMHERAGEITQSDNGAIIPKTIANRIIKKVYDICPILEKSSHYNVKGNLDLPYYDTTDGDITVAYQAEFAALTSTGGKFKAISLTGFLAGALTKISNSLINNSQFNVVDFVIEHMAYAVKRFIEKELLNGTTGKVTGLSTLKTSITAAATSAITTDEVIRLHDAIKDDFQADAIFVMSSATKTALRLLKDANGRYLLQDDISQPFGASLLGRPVYATDNMESFGAGKTVIYYGDMSGLAVKFSEELNMQVLREKYADEHATGVVSWIEFDAKVENEQKIAKLVCATA